MNYDREVSVGNPAFEPAVDPEQGLQLMRELYLGGGRYYFCTYVEKPGKGYSQSLAEFHEDEFEQLRRKILAVNQDEGLAVAVSIGEFWGDRTEASLISLAAFAIDIDADKDFERLVPGATEVDQVIPEVLRRLEGVQLAPHALVRSGSGLHVYILIERCRVQTEQDRHRLKDLWYRLARLLDSTDRYDLSSIMRLPGTINRKHGSRQQAGFIREHTHLDRRRYTLDEIATALAGQPPLVQNQPSQKSQRVPREGQPPPLVEPKVDPREEEILYAVLRIDAHLRELHLQSSTGNRPKGKGGGSAADYEYGCLLLEAGFSEELIRSEVMKSETSKTDGESYVQRTFRKVMSKESREESSLSTATCSYVSLSWRALYQLRRDLLESSNKISPLSPHGDIQATEPPKPKVLVVVARPGDGKTLGAIHDLAMGHGLGYSRMAVCGQFVRELVHHGYVINSTFPWGLTGPLELPETVEDLRKALPSNVQKQPVWTDDRLGQIKYPGAFFLNTFHPRDIDGRLDWLADVASDPEAREEWPLSFWNDRLTGHPHAVLKFRGREDLCLAGHSARALRDQGLCKTCPFLSCGANTNQGGAKTYWSEAPLALLTYRGLELQARFAPEKNNFRAIVLDEIPQFVFRYPSFTVCPKEPSRPRTTWRLDLLDDVEAAFSKLQLSADAATAVQAVFQRARTGAREDLEVRARKLRREARKGTRKPIQQRADDIPPLLSPDDFQTLVRHSHGRRVEEEEDEYEANVPERHPRLTDLLLRLADFAGSEHIKVYLEHSFDKSGGGSLVVCRPVNGWADLLYDHKGRARDLVLLDATAGIDPRYRLVEPGAPELLPTYDFPGTTVVLTSEKTTPKEEVKGKDAREILDGVAATVEDRLRKLAEEKNRDGVPYKPKLLIISYQRIAKSLEDLVPSFQRDGRLPETTSVDYFGNLRGKNTYRDYDAVVFTHIHRYQPLYYVGLALLLSGFGDEFDRQWHHKNLREKTAWNPDLVRYRAMACDLYQDILRIGIRSDPARRALVFIPTPESPFVVRLMRLLRGARLELADGTVLLDSPTAGSGHEGDAARGTPLAEDAAPDAPGCDEEQGPEPAKGAYWKIDTPLRPFAALAVDDAIVEVLYLYGLDRGLLDDRREVLLQKYRDIAMSIPDDWKLEALAEVEREGSPPSVRPEWAAADRVLSRHWPERPRRW
jgi:hypothetical protein